ncbi:TAXI family TRAP transporter solute-binding subunit [Nocardia iowensis]|uniref:TAXI family TRAP transporter solute-binding subunit n=1 Tax=Nocardia iowensis TaxID=204891 RepID=A0ABX8S1U8_NOCIO|nr:TAXI family TRAP transporter solute-binding subunit [Nocardia iowensis]QXN95029.1 TAXI family TRAP transporter solute-binding subunit [Nocardia iowensis]
MRRVAIIFAVTAVSAGLLTGCGGRRDAPHHDSGAAITCEVKSETRVGIATGNATGVYFALGNAYADQVSQATDGKVKATAAETGASVQNIQQLVAGTYQVAFSLADTAADAVLGTGGFDGKKQPVQALSRLYPNYTQVLVRTGANINSVADLRGKRVSTGSPKSGTEVIAQRVLQAAGLNPDSDISAQRLDLTKTVDGMKDGSIDAMFFSGGLPTPGITDLFTSAKDKVRFLDIADQLPAMRKVSPVYEEGTIPAATYGLPADAKTIVVPNVLLVRDDLDADLACVLSKTLFDRKSQLEQANSAAKGISRDTARDTDPVPLHRGADHALTK